MSEESEYWKGIRKAHIVGFIREVEEEAEQAMLQPPYKLEGQHYAAMKRVARRMGIDLWKESEK